jgi:HrpA-like RNA helicase
MAKKQPEYWETVVQKVKEAEVNEASKDASLKQLREALVESLVRKALMFTGWLDGSVTIPDYWEDTITAFKASAKYYLGEEDDPTS